MKMMKAKKKIDKTCKILELPDCVLRILLCYLDATSLYQLTQTCQYLKYFIEDPTFWKCIDARKEPNTDEKIFYCLDRIHEKTTQVLFRARDKNCGQIPTNFFDIINPYKNLKVLALERVRLNGYKISLKQFPKCLEELSLKKSHVKRAEHFFQHSDKSMQKLRVLILDGCRWVPSSFFMSVDKYENLEIVSAVKCFMLHLDMVPYLCVARFGCKKLKIFDCRFTGVGHELLRCFFPKESIQSLYFQSFKSVELDYNESIFNSSYMNTLTYPLENLDADPNIRDDSLIEYLNSIASDTAQAAPNSLLYKDPYPSCTCGYKGQRQQSNSPGQEITEDYYLCRLSRRQLMKFVCQRHLKDVQALPHEFKEFFIANQKQFYIDINSEGDIDSDSSDSDNDNSCCMYGMGREMHLLTLGNNRNLIHEEVIGRNLSYQRDRPHGDDVLASVVRRNRNSDSDRTHSSVAPSTSRNTRLNEHLPNVKGESKRRHSGSGSQNDSPETKRVKMVDDNDLNELNDEIHEAQVNELVESAADVRNRLHRFIVNSMNELSSQPSKFSRQESGPSTSRMVNGIEQINRSVGNQLRRRKNNIWVIIPPEGDASTDRNTSTSEPEVHKSSTTSQERGENSGLQSINQENPSDSPRAAPPREENPSASHHVQQVITFRSRELTRFVNPLYQNSNRHSKKKLGLRRLSLRGFKRITNVALTYIQNLNIELLDLTYTSVTEEGIEDFLVHNPNCRIIHPLYCICKPHNPL